MALENTKPKSQRSEFENNPSNLDDLTHAEIQMLYAESTKTLRFVKTLQWKTVGAKLLIDLALIMIAVSVNADQKLINVFMAITLLITAATILVLVFYQFWMHNEMRKINRMESQLSSLFKSIRAMKSSKEGNIHRYTLLSFMAISIILGAIVVNVALNRISVSY